VQDLILFKALNGEEVIARLIEETDEQYTIEKARVLSMQGTRNPGEVTIAMIPWYLGAPDETIEVQRVHVFSRVKHIPTELAKGYTQQTSTIQLT